jgi:PPOX class probable FMN-dependent enzyme
MRQDPTAHDPIVFIRTESALRDLIGHPSDMVQRKELSTLDVHARAFLACSPLAMMATSGGGSCDVSPRGDGPGFVEVLDDRRIAVPERPGNRRSDSVRNILVNPGIGLLFLVPGVEETLRVNGRAEVVQDAPWFDRMVVRGKRPVMAILVEIAEVYFHCPKPFRRAQLWEQETWPVRSSLPTLGQILKDHAKLDQNATAVDAALEQSYTRTLY